MLSKNRLYAFVILNGLLLLVAVLLFVVVLDREVPSSVLSPEDRRELIEKITSADKLRGLAIRDDEYIRALADWISTMRLILLGSGALVGAFAVTNLVLKLWRSQKKEPSAEHLAGGASRQIRARFGRTINPDPKKQSRDFRC